MNEHKSLLYPAYHKLYSALKSLEDFSEGRDLIDNITYLDNFLLEYRNITFTLQKSLKGTIHENLYISARQKYFSDSTSSWLVKNRNAVSKEKPFDLQKQVTLTLYTASTSNILKVQNFTITEDEGYHSIISQLKPLILQSPYPELYFSIQFLFHDGDKHSLWKYVAKGITNALLCLKYLEKEINDSCPLVNKIKSKIRQLTRYKLPEVLLFTHDYVYHSLHKNFERSFYIYFYNLESLNKRIPLSNFANFLKKRPSNLNEIFHTLKAIYLSVYDPDESEFLPTFMIVYEDKTFRLFSLGFSIKTTAYRIINEIAQEIMDSTPAIQAVFYIGEEYIQDMSLLQGPHNLSYPERCKRALYTRLSFYMIRKENPSQIISSHYSKNEKRPEKPSNQSKNSPTLTAPHFLQPISHAFKAKNPHST